ncbi:MAG: T9SS type A sorting domain-containing protein [Balneola sp.]
MKRIAGLFFLVCLIGTASLSAQIFQPEGVNIPGSWNGFSNSNDSTEMGNFRMDYRSFAGGQYLTTLEIKATDGDTSAGSYAMLFTSGPDGNNFGNKWADANLTIDGFADLTYNSGADNTITVENDFFYTLIFDDNGYANSSAAVLKTSAAPVNIVSVTGTPTDNVAANDPVTIAVELDKAKSAEEKVYIRYSTDNFATSSAVEITNFTGAIGSVDIPGQPLNTVVEFYVLTTTLDEANWNSNIDLATLAFEVNGGSNYRYFYEANILPANGATSVAKTPDFSWFSTDGATGYDFQLSENNDFSTTVEDQSGLTDTTFSVTDPLDINTKYYWRFKTSSATEWSNVYSFNTETEITFANLQFPTEMVIDSGEIFQVYGQLTVPGVTNSTGENADISAWVAVNENNTDPDTWDEASWKAAAFFEDKTSTDEYSTSLGSELEIKKYYFAFRYKYKDQDFVYGGVNGFWNAGTSPSGELDVLEIPQLVSPLNNATEISLEALLDWSATDSRIQGFQLQLATEATFSSPIIDDSGLSPVSTEYTVTSGLLENETKYFWKIRAEYDTTSSGWSETLAFTTLAGIPDKLTTLLPEDDAENVSLSPVFSWNQENRSDSYSIQISTDNNFTFVHSNSSVADTQFVFSDLDSLSAGTRYYWRVQGVNSSGSGAWSDTLTFKTELRVPMLIFPADEAEDVVTDPKLVWRPIDGALNYDLQLSKLSSFSTTVSDSSALSDTTFQATLLENSTSYYWRVRANYAEDIGDWSQAQLFTTKAPAPLAPELLSPENGKENLGLSPTLQWTNVADADSYDLQLSTESDFTSGIVTDSSGIATTTLQTDTLSRNTNYFWRIRAVNNTTGNSDWSETRSFSTIPEIPGAFTLLSPVNQQENTNLPVTFVWSSASGATDYRVQFSTDDTFTFVSDTTTSDTVLTVNSLSATTTYFWRVKASNAGGSTEWSSPFEFKTGISGSEGPALISPLNNAVNLRSPVEFAWDSVALAESYIIQLSETSAFESLITDSSGITGTSVLLTSVQKNKRYFWRVQAMSSSGASAWSQVFSFETEKEIPASPQLLLPEDQSATDPQEIEFVWKEVADAESYDIRISKTENFKISIDSTVTNDTSLTLQSFSFDTDYYWQIRSANASGKSSWSAVFNFKTNVPLPRIPELLSPLENDAVNDPVVFGWNKADYADSYQLQISETQSFESIVIDTSDISGTTVEIDGLAENTEYFWRVRSENSAGNSEWSEAAGFMTQIFTSLEEGSVPTEFKLHQNYPNPFNPGTTIRYDLKTAGPVSIRVYDITGKEVMTLLNGKRSAGSHTVNFNASGLASGVYILRMTTPGFVQIRKMTLIK